MKTNGWFRFKDNDPSYVQSVQREGFLNQDLPGQDVKGSSTLSFSYKNIRPLQPPPVIQLPGVVTQAGLPLQVGTVANKPLIINPNAPWGHTEYWLDPTRNAADYNTQF